MDSPLSFELKTFAPLKILYSYIITFWQQNHIKKSYPEG